MCSGATFMCPETWFCTSSWVYSGVRRATSMRMPDCTKTCFTPGCWRAPQEVQSRLLIEFEYGADGRP